MSLESLLSRYQLAAKSEGKSEKTIAFIRLGTRLFSQFLGGVPDVRKITVEDYRGFVVALQQKEKWSGLPQGRNGGKLSASSVNCYGRAILQFWNWLEREKLVKANPLKGIHPPKNPQLLPKSLSQAEIMSVLKNCQTQRETAIVLLILDTGMRLSELLGLSLKDIDFSAGSAVIFGKGTKQRMAYFSPKTATAIDGYIRFERPESNSDRLFLNDNGTGMRKNRTKVILREIGKRAAGTRLSAHRLRHTFAVMSLRNGSNTEYVRQSLGHSSIGVTQRYVLASGVDIQEARVKFSPVANLAPARKRSDNKNTGKSEVHSKDLVEAFDKALKRQEIRAQNDMADFFSGQTHLDKLIKNAKDSLIKSNK